RARGDGHRLGDIRGHREPDREDSALARLALDRDLSAVAIHDRIGAAEAEPLALLALGRGEGYEDVQSRLLAHPDTGVHDLGEPPSAFPTGAEGQVSALGHRVESVERHAG